MPSLRTRALLDGSTSYTVAFRCGGKQTSETFRDDPAAARAFMRDVERLGAEAARKAKRANDEPVDEALTVS